MLAAQIAIQKMQQIRLGTADDRVTCTLSLAKVGTLKSILKFARRKVKLLELQVLYGSPVSECSREIGASWAFQRNCGGL